MAAFLLGGPQMSLLSPTSPRCYWALGKTDSWPHVALTKSCKGALSVLLQSRGGGVTPLGHPGPGEKPGVRQAREAWRAVGPVAGVGGF